ncbi:hypothetical protein ACLOJK_014363 [Asimina triloba]
MGNIRRIGLCESGIKGNRRGRGRGNYTVHANLESRRDAPEKGFWGRSEGFSGSGIQEGRVRNGVCRRGMQKENVQQIDCSNQLIKQLDLTRHSLLSKRRVSSVVSIKCKIYLRTKTTEYTRPFGSAIRVNSITQSQQRQPSRVGKLVPLIRSTQ